MLCKQNEIFSEYQLGFQRSKIVFQTVFLIRSSQGDRVTKSRAGNEKHQGTFQLPGSSGCVLFGCFIRDLFRGENVTSIWQRAIISGHLEEAGDCI